MRWARLLPILATALCLMATLVSPVGAVVGGAPTDGTDWPSVVALVRADEADPVVGQFCGGTAIAEDLVLTAAHCFHTTTGQLSRRPEDVTVVARTVDLASDDLEQVGSVSHGVELFVHPEFEASTYAFDVAILRVDGPLGVPAQRLAVAGSDRPRVGTFGVILGWGRTGPEPGQSSASTGLLHEAHVEFRSDRTCRTAYSPEPDTSQQICAGGEGSEEQPEADACSGDSGGPLLLPVRNEPSIQIGITAYGNDVCGVDKPGVYGLISAAREFIDAVVGGAGSATVLNDPAASEVLRIAAVGDAADGQTTAIAQAIASSQAVFEDGEAQIAIVARDDDFPDGLAGSSLVFGRGPLLFTAPREPLAPATAAELRRVLPDGATVYLLGGAAAIPESVAELIAADGFTPVRLAGDTREATAAAVADEVIAQHGDGARPPFGTVILATSASWPDAVLAGQLTAYWGYPLLLTQPGELHPSAAGVLARADVDRVLVVGGDQSISPDAEGAATDITGGRSFRIDGGDRVETGLALASFHRAELARQGLRSPDTVVAVNVRRADGFAHILSASPIVGLTAGVFLPVEGDAGDILTTRVERQFCGFGGTPIGIGGADLLADEVLAAVGRQVTQSAC